MTNTPNQDLPGEQPQPDNTLPGDLPGEEVDVEEGKLPPGQDPNKVRGKSEEAHRNAPGKNKP